MDSEKCRILLKVLVLGSMSAAADALGYTASGISRAIESMERQTGFPLLNRNRSHCTLTPEGETLLPIIRELAFWSERYESTARQLRGLECGSVSVGIAYVEFYPWLIPVISAFHEQFPGISVNITEGNSSKLCEMIVSRTLDFALISRRDSNARWVPIKTDELMAVLPAKHASAQGRRVPVELFGSEPYIEIMPNQETDNSRCLHMFGIQPHIRFSTNSVAAAFNMVGEGFGIALANALLCSELPQNVRALPLDPPVPVEIGVMLPNAESLSPAAARFGAFAVGTMKKEAITNPSALW